MNETFRDEHKPVVLFRDVYWPNRFLVLILALPPPAGTHSVATPGGGGAGKPGHCLLSGRLLEEAGLGSTKNLFG